MKITTKELRPLLNKEVQYVLTRDALHLVTPPIRFGTLEEISGNVLINGNWYWFGAKNSDLHSIEAKKE